MDLRGGIRDSGSPLSAYKQHKLKTHLRPLVANERVSVPSGGNAQAETAAPLIGETVTFSINT